MSDTSAGEHETQRDSEAAAWLIRLNSRTVDTSELEAFFAWRRVPANARAYDRMEAQWRESRKLADDPDIQEAMHEALDPDAHRTRPENPLRAALAACVLIAVACAGLFYVSAETVLETGTGEQRLVQLDDGSRVHLDTGTRIRISRWNNRALVLEHGRALFDVAHDASRPFSVTSDATEILALGTRFEVDQREATVSVALVEGRVRIQKLHADEMAALELDPGQIVTIGTRGPSAIRSATPADIAPWTMGRLEFSDTPLIEAINEINRYSRTKLRLKASRWADERVTGIFSVEDMPAFVDAVTALYPLELRRLPDGTLELQER